MHNLYVEIHEIMRGQPLSTETAPQPRDGDAEPAGLAKVSRRLPVGAEVQSSGGVHFRVWAPGTSGVKVQLTHSRQFSEEAVEEVRLVQEADGYFSAQVNQARPGMLYKFSPGTGSFPDPASRFQPDGPHGASQIIDPTKFTWSDQNWRGVRRRGQVIYEMHIGTFTREGNWRAAQEQLSELARLGITVLEVMPVADFPGRFGWGYDGVDLFAPTRLYGSSDDFRSFVNEAHLFGLGVILDVVYNHVGPDGNYLKEFSEDYFTDRYQNEWGEALNFDGPNSGPVREFFCANAAYWIDEFHLDGLRLDATQQMFDSSPMHILREIGQSVRKAAGQRSTYVVAENESQHAVLARPVEGGGYGLDAMWNDDFHHSVRVALTGRNEAYYCDFRGTPQEIVSALKHGFLFQGQWFTWQKKLRGTPAGRLAREQFINFLQNHDQIANSLSGRRLHQLTTPGRLRAMTAVLLLGPATPMLFQGQEFAASTPFLFFADHHPELARVVAKGRRDFLSQFPTIACTESSGYLNDPAAAETFKQCKLDITERLTHTPIYEMHRDLLKLRREDPVFSQPNANDLDGAILSEEAFAVRSVGQAGEERLVLINLGRDLRLSPIPEPLLAPPENCAWETQWSSENPRYGGGGAPPVETGPSWFLPGHAGLVLKNVTKRSLDKTPGAT
jgi:maltooligosyltrehalose trehalohydrolase